MVISAHEIPELSGTNAIKWSLLSVLNKTQPSFFQKSIFQVDHKDAQGRYILNNNTLNGPEGAHVFKSNDELVFRKKDLGYRLNHSSALLEKKSLIEIKITSDSAGLEKNTETGWIYIALNESTDLNVQKKVISYETEQDIISSPFFKIVFSKEKPFLLDAFHWRLSDGSRWSHDVTDTMKIRHIGQFLGFPFRRTDDDYFSRLVDVKQGPLRIIRRTENKVKVFWKLKSPALYIDYIMMPDGFVMDSMVDIPFKISFFFSDLSTVTTMDWNNAFENTALIIHSSDSRLNLPIDGRPSDDKRKFNQIVAQEFSVSSSLGLFDVRLAIPDDFPIRSQLYLNDDLKELDPPEHYPGQFGNVGFKTTGWENINSKLHHLKFTVCVDQNAVNQ